MSKHSYVTVTDLFCGAGGSSLGVLQSGGEVAMAVNRAGGDGEFPASGKDKTPPICYNWGNEIESPGAALTAPARVNGGSPMTIPQSTPAPENQQECWRAVVGYEGRYEVSSLGRVRSLGVRGKLLATSPVKGGYLRVSLSRDSHDRKYLVHCLVAAAFIGPRPGGCEVNHKDRKTNNNRDDNLEYLTPTQNVRHSFAVGERHPARGERNANARLSDATAAAIRSAFAAGGVTKASLARAHGLSTTLVGRLLNGRTYAERS